MEMVVEQRPGEAVRLGGDQKIREPLDELAAIVIVVEDVALFDTAHDDVLQEVRDVNASGTWHGVRVTAENGLVNVLRTSPRHTLGIKGFTAFNVLCPTIKDRRQKLRMLCGNS